jgi:hypothetical protein
MVTSMFVGVVALGAGTAAAAVTTLDTASAQDIGADQSSATQIVNFDVTIDGADSDQNVTVDLSQAAAAGVSPSVTGVSLTGGDTGEVSVTDNGISNANHSITLTDDTGTSSHTVTVQVEYDHDTTGVSPATVTFPIRAEADNTVNTSATFDVIGVVVSPTEANVDPNEIQNFSVTVTNGSSNLANRDVSVNAGGANVVTAPTQTGANGEAAVFQINNSTSGAFDIQFSDGGDTGASTNASLLVSEQDTNLVDGEITDTQLQTIENAEDVQITITALAANTDNLSSDLVIVDGVNASDFNSLAANNNFIENAGFNVSGNDDYFIRLPAFGDTQYRVSANLPGFDSFAGNTQVIQPGDSDTQNIRLTRNINADTIRVVDPDEDPTDVDPFAGDVNVTAEVTTDDRASGDDEPLADSNVDADAVISDDPNGLFNDADAVVSPASQLTDDNGLAEFNVDLDTSGVDLDNVDQDVTVEVTFTATDTGGSPISVTQNVTFVAEPPSGSGTIAGDVDQFSPSTPIGIQSQTSSPAEDVNVHAVQFDRVADNTQQYNLSLGTDTTTFARVVNATNGAPLDVQTDYLITSGEVGITTNATIPGTGFDVETGSTPNAENFSIHVLEEGDYLLQTSGNGTFTSPTNQTEFTATNNLTYEATQERFSDVRAVQTDVTGEDGEYALVNVFTNGSTGEDYVVIAGDGNADLGFANGYGYDAVTVDQNSQTGPGAEQYEVNLGVQEVDVQLDGVDIVQIGEHLPLDQTDGEYDPGAVNEFDNGENDDAFQQVTRNGSVDVFRVSTTLENGDFANGTVEVSLQNEDPAGELEAEFVGVVGGQNLTALGSETVTIATGNDGNATLLLESDSGNESVDAVKRAVLQSNEAITDESNVTFVGVTSFGSASIRGDVTDTDDTPLRDTAVFAKRFDFPTRANSELSVTIEPDTSAAPGTEAYAEAVDDDDDEFVVTLFRDNGTALVEVRNATVEVSDLRNYNFAEFPSLDTGGQTFKLYDQSEGDLSYTLDPVPAVENDDRQNTDYRISAVKLDVPDQGEVSNDALPSVLPNTTATADVVIPIQFEPASVSFSPQSGDGTNATIDSFDLGSDGQTVSVWTVDESGNPETLLGSVTPSQASGSDLTVEFDQATIDSTQTLVAAVHSGTPAADNVIAASGAEYTVESNTEQNPLAERFDGAAGQPEDGTIQFEELLEVIDAANTGDDVTFPEVLDVIDAFNTDQQWSSV